MWTWILILALVVGLALAGRLATRHGYESAPYRVVRTDGPVQVRDYPALTVVETPMAAGVRDGQDGSFGRLFGFITGSNDAQQKIAMTTPVFMSGDETSPTMAFVLPAKMGAGDVPMPADPAVAVRQLDGGRYAVLRYRGDRSADAAAEALARLQAWLQTQELRGSSSPLYGYFDPPWTPGFLRRNEVMLRLEALSQEPAQ